MKIYLTETQINQLNSVKGEMLLGTLETGLIRITDFKIEDVVKKKRKGDVVHHYLTECTIQGYNPHGRFLGVFSDSATSRIIDMKDLIVMRGNFLAIVDALKAFGFDVLEKITEYKEVSDEQES